MLLFFNDYAHYEHLSPSVSYKVHAVHSSLYHFKIHRSNHNQWRFIIHKAERGCSQPYF